MQTVDDILEIVRRKNYETPVEKLERLRNVDDHMDDKIVEMVEEVKGMREYIEMLEKRKEEIVVVEDKVKFEKTIQRMKERKVEIKRRIKVLKADQEELLEKIERMQERLK